MIIHLYLSDSAEYAVSLDSGTKRELCDLLLKDIGVTKLMEACVTTTEVYILYHFIFYIMSFLQRCGKLLYLIGQKNVGQNFRWTKLLIFLSPTKKILSKHKIWTTFLVR